VRAKATLFNGPINGLCTRNCAERVDANGDLVTEFSYSNYADHNDPGGAVGRVLPRPHRREARHGHAARSHGHANADGNSTSSFRPPAVKTPARPSGSRDGFWSERGKKAMTSRFVRYSLMTLLPSWLRSRSIRGSAQAPCARTRPPAQQDPRRFPHLAPPTGNRI